jgi:hypothetical protein
MINARSLFRTQARVLKRKTGTKTAIKKNGSGCEKSINRRVLPDR